MAAIIGLIGGWRAAAFLIAAVALAGYVGFQSWQLSRARAEAEHWRASSVTYAAANHATVEAFERYRADQEAVREALARESARSAAQAAESARLIEEARNATDDRPYGPVLRRYYERLRREAGGGGGSVSGPDAAEGAADVR